MCSRYLLKPFLYFYMLPIKALQLFTAHPIDTRINGVDINARLSFIGPTITAIGGTLLLNLCGVARYMLTRRNSH